MADAYGTLVFSCSKDAKFEGEYIVDKLNQYEWDMEGGKWVLDGEEIDYDGDSPLYPTVYPNEVKSITLEINGVFKKISPIELTEEQEDDIVDKEEESVSLEKFRDSLAPFINTGWIEISCIANERARYIYLQEMRIYSDGRATRKRTFIGTNKYFGNEREEESLPKIT